MERRSNHSKTDNLCVSRYSHAQTDMPTIYTLNSSALHGWEDLIVFRPHMFFTSIKLNPIFPKFQILHFFQLTSCNHKPGVLFNTHTVPYSIYPTDRALELQWDLKDRFGSLKSVFNPHMPHVYWFTGCCNYSSCPYLMWRDPFLVRVYCKRWGTKPHSVLCKNAFQIQAVANEASAFWVTQIG